MPEDARGDDETSSESGSKKRILIVEDEVMVALDLSLQLEDEGYSCLGPASTVAAALGLLRDATPDFAVLDANLGGEMPAPIAEELARRGVPFVYVSGYNGDYIDKNLPPAPLIGKPLPLRELLWRIREATNARDPANAG